MRQSFLPFTPYFIFTPYGSFLVYITVFYWSWAFLNVSINRQPIIYVVSISLISSSIDFIMAVQCLLVVIKLTSNCFVLWGRYIVQIFCSIFVIWVASLMSAIGNWLQVGILCVDRKINNLEYINPLKDLKNCFIVIIYW